MRIESSPVAFRRLPGAMPAFVATVDETQWTALADAFAADGRLVAVWASDRRASGESFVVHVAYGAADGLAVVRLPVSDTRCEYPDLARRFPAAARMQRAIFDLLGLRAAGADDTRPWLRHGAWPENAFPLREDF